MAAGKHKAAAVVHGLGAWRLLLLPSVIGDRESLLSRRWTGTSCSPARRRFAEGIVPAGRQRTDCRVGIGTDARN